MKLPSRRTTLLAGLGLIMLTNAVALGGVWWNRSGEPDSVLALSQRELRVDSRPGDENSGLALALEWRAVGYEDPDANFDTWLWADRGSPAWLGRDKMRTLGFAPPPASDAPRAAREDSREAFLVLEFDGPAYHAYRARLQSQAEREIGLPALDPDNKEFAQRAARAQEYLKHEGQRSRLFAVDAGLKQAELRASYPDRNRYAIVRAEIAPMGYVRDVKGPHGYVRRIHVGSVHVPFAYREVFESAGYVYPATPDKVPAFAAEMAFGKRLEPWLRSVQGAAPAK